MASNDARGVRQRLGRPGDAVPAAEVLGTGAGLPAPQLLRDVTEGRFVNLRDADVAAEPSAQVIDLHEVSGHVSPVVVIAVRDLPVPRQIRRGGLRTLECL